MRPIFPILLLTLFIACKETPPPDPQVIIDSTIQAHGGDRLDGSTIDFDFRGTHFTVMHNQGAFSYVRSFRDSAGLVRDVLYNDGFYREINGNIVEPSNRMRQILPGSVNSVVYFALLPFKLDDPSVKERYLGEEAVKGERYHKVEITFTQHSGGTDWNDVFVYWIHKDNNSMDYLAYLYHVNGGGTRFREAHNIRTVEGIRFADYRNYKAETENLPLEEYGRAFNKGGLVKVSDVDIENIQVKLGN